MFSATSRRTLAITAGLATSVLLVAACSNGGTNGTFLGALCLKPSDKKGLKAARQLCEDRAEACCLDGDLEACPTSNSSRTPNICFSFRCPLGSRLWYCEVEANDHH